MSNTDQLALRYVSGLIRNRGIGRQFWIEPTILKNPVARAMVSELKGMFFGEGIMTPELIVDRLLKNRTIGEVWSPDQVFEFVNSAVNQEIERTEVHHLHSAIMRDHVFASAKVTMSQLMQKMDTPEALDMAMAAMRELKAAMPEQTVNLEAQMLEAIDEASNGGKALLPFGIPIMDERLGGFSRGEVAIIAGRPGHGKTSLANQLSINWLDQGLRVLIISKEMKTFRLLHKIIANQSEFTSRQLHRGELSEEEKAKLKEEARKLVQKYDGRLFIYDDIYDTHRIETAIAKHKPDVIIDDFIQLTACDDSNMRLEILRIMKAYKQMAKEYNAAVVTLSQLNRSIETRDDPVPRLSDLAESGAIEQLAADVLFVYYPHKIDPQGEPADQVNIIASKTRYGTTARFILGFDGQHMRYRQIPVIAR